MSGHHPATVRRAGRKRGTRFESSEALAEQPAVARSAVELHRCCSRVSRAAALVRQHIDGVARASSAGTKSGSSARSLVLLTMLVTVSRTARFRDQLQLDDGPNSKIADRYTTLHRVAVGDLPTSSVSGPQLVPEQACSVPAPPGSVLHTLIRLDVSHARSAGVDSDHLVACSSPWS
eukprot:scaffold1962_cov59-Phaeocystis_antarctica.AAC.2